MKSLSKVLVCVAASWLLLASESWAQISGGSIVGSVLDSSGAAIAGATVTATNVATNEAQKTVTSDVGYFEFPLLPAGRYRLEAEKSGFARERTALLVFPMTTPPETLVKNQLWFDGLIDLRTPDGSLDSRITATHAIALAIRGEIEGVGPRNGRIKYLRYLPLPQAARHAEKPHREEIHRSRSTAFARTNLGVYREPIVQSDALTAGLVIGYCYAHCQLRGIGL